MPCFIFIFFFHGTATTEIYTLSLHDALPIYTQSTFATFIAHGIGGWSLSTSPQVLAPAGGPSASQAPPLPEDRKSTRLNSSHVEISYAVFCLKKKNKCTTFIQVASTRHLVVW